MRVTFWEQQHESVQWYIRHLTMKRTVRPMFKIYERDGWPMDHAAHDWKSGILWSQVEPRTATVNSLQSRRVAVANVTPLLIYRFTPAHYQNISFTEIGEMADPQSTLSIGTLSLAGWWLGQSKIWFPHVKRLYTRVSILNDLQDPQEVLRISDFVLSHTLPLRIDAPESLSYAACIPHGPSASAELSREVLKEHVTTQFIHIYK